MSVIHPPQPTGFAALAVASLSTAEAAAARHFESLPESQQGPGPAPDTARAGASATQAAPDAASAESVATDGRRAAFERRLQAVRDATAQQRSALERLRRP